MAGTIARYKKGKITVNLIEGNYKGEPSFSYTVNKSVFKKETKTWETSNFLGITDLQDLVSILNTIIVKYVKVEKVKEPKPQSQNEPYLI